MYISFDVGEFREGFAAFNEGGSGKAVKEGDGYFRRPPSYSEAMVRDSSQIETSEG